MNTFGRLLRMHIFGESHGQGVGAVFDGLPAGMPIEVARIQAALDRRRPAQGPATSSRREPDQLEILSGLYRGCSTGAPLALWIANHDARERDYRQLHTVPRPGHADWPALVRSRGHHDVRGGGHFSGRLTAPLVACGAIAAELLRGHGVEVAAHLHAVAGIEGGSATHDVAAMRAAVDGNRCKTAHQGLLEAFEAAIAEARKAGDSVGGVIEFRAEGLPVGVGEPWTDSIESHLSHLLFAIPAVKGVSFGAGFAAATMRGSEHNDGYRPDGDGGIETITNHAGGIVGGLSTGSPLWGHVAIKPTSSIFVRQQSVDLPSGQARELILRGRHDTLIAIRAVPVVEAAVALSLADLLMVWHAEQGVGAAWPERSLSTEQE